MGIVRVTVGIVYYMPDYRSLLQELYWSTDDRDPDLPRVRKYLDFWRREIDAVVRDVLISKSPVREDSWRRVDWEIHG